MMNKDYIGNLRAIAGVNLNAVSEQHLQILKLKYHLSDTQIEDLYKYCDCHSIRIYDECINIPEYHSEAEMSFMNKLDTIEKKIHEELVNVITERIINIAVNKMRKSMNRKNWLCDIPFHSQRHKLFYHISRVFSYDDLTYIATHLSPPNDEETAFVLYDEVEPNKSHHFTELLNNLVLTVRVYRRKRNYDYLD